MPVFISEVKLENSTKKKNEHRDIWFLINYKFLCKISFKLISFFLFLQLHCGTFFILDLNDLLALMVFFFKMDFSLKNKLRAYFSLFLCSFISQKHVAYSQEKIWHFSLSTFLKYEKLIF